jgi:hypothetical protein
MKTKNITSEDHKISINGIYYNVSRVVEISKVGNHSISFVYLKDTDNEHKVKESDIKLISEYFNVKPCINGDLLCEIVRPDWSCIELAIFRDHETLSEIDSRIETAKKYKRPDIKTMSTACYSLLGTAYDRLNLSVSDIDIIRNISATIAQMGYSDTIRLEHIAEAIQYRSIDLNEYKKY